MLEFWTFILASSHGMIGLLVGCIMRRDLSRHILNKGVPHSERYCSICGEFSMFADTRKLLMYSAILTWPLYIVSCILIEVALLLVKPFIGIPWLYDQVHRSVIGEERYKRDLEEKERHKELMRKYGS